MPETRLSSDFSIRPIDLKAASDHEYERSSYFFNTLRQERLPDDPPTPLEEQIQRWKNIPNFIEEEDFNVWDAGQTEVIGCSSIWIDHTGANEHNCDFNIMVLPQYRCQGIARQLLPRLVDFARRNDRRLLKTTTFGTVPAGEAFMRRLGAHPGLETRINQLKISDLPAGWVEKWVHAGEALSSRFELGLWEGPVPEEDLPAVAALIELVFRDAPHDELDEEPIKMTPDSLRQWEKFRTAAGFNWWTMYVRDRSNGQFAGWTEVVWNPQRPMIVEQSGTGVYPEYRGRGLGHWLKASMAHKVLSDLPGVQVIRTDNANSNAAMLKINQEMGYKPYTTLTFWQIERDRLEEYLTGNLPKTA